MVSLKRIYLTSGIVVLAIVLGLVAFTTWYTVDESEQAVILTLDRKSVV